MPAVSLDIDGETYALTCSNERTFKSKSKGFWANGHVRVAGKEYNVSFPLVEIGSKPSK